MEDNCLKILVISGKAGSGKSLLAEHIKRTYEQVFNWRVAELAFADPLKMVAKNLYGWDGNKGQNGRELLQRLGTDIIQKNNQFCWVNCIANIIKGLSSEYDLFIVSDLRFFHEIDHLKDSLPEADIVTIRVEGKTSLHDEQAQHISETELDYCLFDYYFPNKDYNIDIFFYNLNLLIQRLNKEGIDDDNENSR